MNLFSKAKNLFDSGKKKDPSDDENNNDLFDHVQRGDLDYIKTVNKKVLLKSRDKDGNTVLMIATEERYLDLCKEILKKCPSILYHENNYNKTVLQNKGDIHMKFKRWMKMQDLKGDTALIEAARLGNLHVVKRLVEVDRQYDLGLSKVVGDREKTALNWAEENEYIEIVKLLTDDGDPFSDFVPYSTAIDLFNRVRSGDLDYIKTVELNVLLHSRDRHRMSALCIATQSLQLGCCKEILTRCPSLLYQQNNGKMSVLHHAADQYFPNYWLIDFFISTGLEAAKSGGGTENMIRFEKWINLQNIYGKTALYIAVINHSYDIVKRFAEVDRQYELKLSETGWKENKSPLQWAMFYDDHEMMKALTGSEDPNLDCGANTDDDNFPISIAMQQAKESLPIGNRSDTGVAWESNIFTLAEASKHNNLKVFGVTKNLGDHLGGSEVLLKASGNDAATDFKKVHSHSSNAVTMMDKFYVGVCDSITSSLSKLASDIPQPYTRVQLKEFTKDFSQPLGSGGFGDVYKGRFSDGVFIAVKVLKNIEFKEEVMEKQFVAEVETMGRAYHRNLIKLYGYCYEAKTKYKALVYDYMDKFFQS